jgi:hypothetical protein
MVPSVDSVGRYYPLTLVCELARKDFDPEQTLGVMSNWFETAEMLATQALDPETDIGSFDDSVAALPLPIDCAPAVGAQSKAFSAWTSMDSDVGAGWTFQAQGLPSIDQYCAMLTGKPAQITAAAAQ